MNNNVVINEKDIEIKEEIIKELMTKIIVLENNNIRTKNKKDSDIIREIERMIEGKVDDN